MGPFQPGRFFRANSITKPLRVPHVGLPSPPSPYMFDCLGHIKAYRFQKYTPEQTDNPEQFYKNQLYYYLKEKFPGHVEKEVWMAGGRVDIEVHQQVAIELKVPPSAGEMSRLIGQMIIYSGKYGPNIIPVIFVGRMAKSDIERFRSYFHQVLSGQLFVNNIGNIIGQNLLLIED